MSQSHELYAFVGSPWSLKTVWALNSIDQSFLSSNGKWSLKEHQPFITNFILRWKLNDWNGLITVPLLFLTDVNNKRTAIRESYEIIGYAAGLNQTKNEFARLLIEKKDEIRKWDLLAERVLKYGRQKVYDNDDDVLQYMVPAFVPKFITRGLTNMMNRSLSTKYKNQDQGINLEEVEDMFTQAEKVLSKPGIKYLVDNKFSYADVSFAAALEMTLPEMYEPPICASPLLQSMVVKWRPYKWEERYPNVMKHKSRMLKDHLDAQTRKICEVKISRPIVRM